MTTLSEEITRASDFPTLCSECLSPCSDAVAKKRNFKLRNIKYQPFFGTVPQFLVIWQ